jgi:hypothetical protein
MNGARSLGIALLGTVVLAACGGRQPSDVSLTAAAVAEPTGALVIRPIDPSAFDPVAMERASREGGESIEDAVHSIAVTFCDHEQTCDNVGASRSYATQKACVDRQERSRGGALEASVCGSRVARASVARCLDILRGTPCVLDDDGASRVPECRAGALCSKDRPLDYGAK